jgi:O-acetylhomoserine (thiol)-lyase
LSKYICGNGTSLGGAIIDAGTFDWSSGRFPEFTEPNLVIMVYVSLYCYCQAKVRIEGLRDYGAALESNAFQIIQGLETLSIQKHSETD